MRVKAVGLIALLVVALASASFAAVCPQGDAVGAMSPGGPFDPLRVAVDSSGRSYVVDNFNNSLQVYNYAGQLVERRYIIYPLGVAVDDADMVYVGRAGKEGADFIGDVTVYDPSFNELFSLGSGPGEFQFPVGIATDADRVYVADSRANAIKAYNKADGSFLFSFGGSYSVPPVAGDLVRPDGIAVHPATGDLYVTDRALYFDTTSTAYYDWEKWAMGAGIHVFTRDGSHVSSFGTFGYSGTPGEISLIGGMTLDDAGRVYVSDYNMGFLHVFDDAGDTVCAFNYDNPEGSLPQGLATGDDGRLLVATSGSIRAIGIDDYAALSVTPTELAFSSQQCGSQPDPLSLTINNNGGGTLQWSAFSSAAWLAPAATSGTVAGHGSANVPVQVNKDGLGIGTHTASLTFSSAGAERTVSVTLEVLAPSVLSASPLSFNFSVEGSGANPSDTLSIELAGGGAWNASSDSAWLSVTPASGPSNTLIMASVGVDTSGLTGGTYNGNLTISAECTSNSPLIIPVSLSYTSGGTIEVTTNLDDAAFTLTGPATYSGSGKSFTVDDAPEGTYTIEFDDVEGFLKPASYSLGVQNSETTRFNGEYRDLRQRLNILASQGDAPGSMANELRVFGGDGTLQDSILLENQGSGKYFWRNSVSASGDIDGDGAEEIIVSHDMGVITGLEADGTQVPGLEFMPFADRAYVDVDVADLDGDGVEEIIVSSMHWTSNGAAVRVIGYSGGQVYDTGINFLAYTKKDFVKAPKGSKDPGTKVAAGDIDGDGKAEILTVQAGGYYTHNIKARIFSVDTSGGPGNWAVNDAGMVSVDGMYSYYSDITAGDINSDGVDEVIVSATPEDIDTVQLIKVMAFGADGAMLLDMDVDSIRGVDVAAGDLDYDGAAEIVVGEGAFKEGDSSRIRVFEADGTLQGSFLAFDVQVTGVRISVGDVSK